jgi:hypothetical protein
VTGPLNASNLISHDFSVTGPISVSKGTLKKISVTGPVSLTDVSSDDITITGYSDFTNVTVAKECMIIGMLNATQSKFNNVSLTMSESVIRDSAAKSIVVKHPDSDEAHQKLMLYGNTRIDAVTFESGQGEIYVYGSNVKLSNASGAKVIRH